MLWLGTSVLMSGVGKPRVARGSRSSAFLDSTDQTTCDERNVPKQSLRTHLRGRCDRETAERADPTGRGGCGRERSTLANCSASMTLEPQCVAAGLDCAGLRANKGDGLERTKASVRSGYG